MAQRGRKPKPTALKELEASVNLIQKNLSRNGKLYYTYTSDKNGTIVFRKDEILHIVGLGFDGLIGYSPIAMAKNALGSDFSEPEAAIDEALEKLNIGYIDMMLLHHPGDNDVKAYKAIEQYIAAGKIHTAGLSNRYIEEIDDFISQVSIKPDLVQNEIHPYYQEQEVVPYMHNLGIAMQAWYPLGGRGHTAELLGNETIVEIANAHGKSVRCSVQILSDNVLYIPSAHSRVFS